MDTKTHSHTRLAPSVFRRPRLKARALFSNYRLRSEKQMIRATQLGDSALGWHASAQEQLFVMCPAKPRASSISDPTSKHSEFRQLHNAAVERLRRGTRQAASWLAVSGSASTLINR